MGFNRQKSDLKLARTLILDELFDLGYHFKHVDTIFKRVFGES